jgi:hypothetical protein
VRCAWRSPLPEKVRPRQWRGRPATSTPEHPQVEKSCRPRSRPRPLQLGVGLAGTAVTQGRDVPPQPYRCRPRHRCLFGEAGTPSASAARRLGGQHAGAVPGGRVSPTSRAATVSHPAALASLTGLPHWPPSLASLTGLPHLLPALASLTGLSPCPRCPGAAMALGQVPSADHSSAPATTKRASLVYQTRGRAVARPSLGW